MKRRSILRTIQEIILWPTGKVLFDQQMEGSNPFDPTSKIQTFFILTSKDILSGSIPFFWKYLRTI